MATDWIELPGFPRSFASQCAPWTSSVRFVNGVREMKGGKSVTLSGAKAFVQGLEMALIEGRRKQADVAALVDAVLEAHARHIDVVEWCRVRDQELDMGLRVYASRGVARVHMALNGPIGRYVDLPLPERAVTKPAAKKRAKVAAGVSVSEATVSVEPVVGFGPPQRELLLRPLPEGLEVRGAGLMPQGGGQVLRVLHGMTEERRYPLRIGKKLELEVAAGTVLMHGLEGMAQVVPNSRMWVVTSDEGGCGLTLVREDRSRVPLFELPRSFTGPGYAPWGWPLVSEIAGAQASDACWQVAIDFGTEDGPRCTGALTLARDGRVCASAFVDADETLRIGDTTLALGEQGRVLGYAGGPAGDLAALLLLADGVGLLWAPPRGG